MINVLGVLFVSVMTLLSRITQQSDSLQENIPEISLQKTCPSCHSHSVIKNGSIHNGKPKSQCKDCERQFVDSPNNIVISLQIKQLIDKLLPSANFLTWNCESYGCKLVLVTKLRQSEASSNSASSQAFR